MTQAVDRERYVIEQAMKAVLLPFMESIGDAPATNVSKVEK